KLERDLVVDVIVDLGVLAFEKEPIFLAREIVAPQTLFRTEHELGVVPVAFPCEWRRPVESNPLFAESELARFQNEQENDVTKRGGEQSAHGGGEPRFGVHQFGDEETRHDSRDGAADRDLVGNDEVFKIDKGCDDHERHKHPIGKREWPWKSAPDGEEQERGDELDPEITKANRRAAMGAAAAEKKPARERDVLIPRNGRLAVWAKGAARFVNREVERQSIDADVQK